MSLHPVNDNIMVEISTDKYGFAGKAEQQGTETGIVVELPMHMWYLGMHSFAFEDSLGNIEVMKNVKKVFEDYLGKRVYWTAFTERGSVLKDGNKTYAFLKLTDLIAVEDDIKAKAAKSVETAQGGGVSLN